MAQYLCIQKQLTKMTAALTKMGNPYRGIDDDHGYDFAVLRLGIGRRSFSVPPNLARRRLLSRAIKDSSPSRTKAVFSLMPVNRDASSKISSSMFSVVLMCMSMHFLCIYVNGQSLPEKITRELSCLYTVELFVALETKSG